MVDKSDIAEMIAPKVGAAAANNSPAVKTGKSRTDEVESARQKLKNQIEYSNLSAEEKAKLNSQVDGYLNDVLNGTASLAQVVAGLDSVIRQEIASEAQEESLSQAVSSTLVQEGKYEAIRLSVAAQRRIAHYCEHYNLNDRQSVYNYASNIVDHSAPPIVQEHEAQSLTNYMMNDPEGRVAAHRWESMTPEQRKARMVDVEKARHVLEEMASDSSLTSDQKEKIQGAITGKHYGNHKLREVLQKYKNGEVDIEAVMAVDAQIEARNHNRIRQNAHNHCATQVEQNTQNKIENAGLAVCTATEDVDLFLQHKDDPEWIKKAQGYLAKIAKGNMSGLEQPQIDIAMAYMHHNPEVEKQFFSDMIQSGAISKERSMSQIQGGKVGTRSIGGLTQNLYEGLHASKEAQLFERSMAVMKMPRGHETATVRIETAVDLVMQNDFLRSYDQKYKGSVQTTLTKMEADGELDIAFDKAVKGVMAAKGIADSAGTAVSLTTVGIVGNIFNTNKAETDAISKQVGAGTISGLKKIGVSEKTAHEWGVSVTENLKAGAAKKDAIIASVTESTGNFMDFAAAAVGHNTLGNQIDKNLAAINKNAVFVAVSDGNGNKIFNGDGKGGISKEELLKTLAKHGITDLKQLDKNGDGLSEGELIGAMNKIMKEERAAGAAEKMKADVGKLIPKIGEVKFTQAEKNLFGGADGKIDLADRDKILAVLKREGVDLSKFDKDKNGIDVKELGEAMHAAATHANANAKKPAAKVQGH